MSIGAWMMLVAVVVTLGALVVLAVTMARGIRRERTSGRPLWREFGLGLTLMMLFLATWVAHLISQWQVYTDEQAAQGASTELGDFTAEFAQATLENWQSEFLQLFSFVVLASLLIHKGSAESKDSDQNIEASLRRLEEHLGTLPATAPSGPDDHWKLPDTALEVDDPASS